MVEGLRVGKTGRVKNGEKEGRLSVGKKGEG